MQSPFSYLRLIGLGAVLVIVPSSVHAQDDFDSEWNHFGLNFRAGFNMNAKFSETGSGAGALPPGPGAGPALNHQYTDGYVNVDSSGNRGGVTWNWSYQNASQIGGEGGTVLMHDTAAVGGGADRVNGDPNLGIDFNYVRDIVHGKWGQFGIKFGFGYTPMDIRDNNPLTTGVETITDTYALNGVTPPVAPYTGSFSGPGPVLGSEPISRSTSLAPGGMSIGQRELDVSLFDFRLGPAFNIPLAKRFSLQLGGGLAVGVADSQFSFTTLGGPGAPSFTGGNTHTGVNPGAYAEVGFAYRLCKNASIFTGMQYEYLGNFQQTSSGNSAELDLGSTIFYELGLQWHF
jgi:hypothetical protein